MFFLLILFISGWVVAASLMAEKTNVGVAVFNADITYMCGLWSDGAAALLSACSLVRCCSHHFNMFLSSGVVLEHSYTLRDQLQDHPGHSVILYYTANSSYAAV